MEYKKHKKHTYIKTNKPNKNQHIDTETRVVITRGEGEAEGEMDEGGQLYGDTWKLHLWW